MIFFIIKFWERLKKHRPVKASLEGINAASAGIVFATAVLLAVPVFSATDGGFPVNVLIFLVTLLLLSVTKIPPPVYILAGLILGIVL
jgi:chromate transporter